MIERRRLVRAIDACTQGHLVHAGRRYRLAADVDLDKIPGCVEYAVLPQTQAQRILAELAGEGRLPADLVALLVQARNRLSHDWRAPLSHPDGLVLLHKDLRPRRLTASASREKRRSNSTSGSPSTLMATSRASTGSQAR